jgi:hypothetical protein
MKNYDKMTLPELEEEKKRLTTQFDKVQKESVKDLKESVEDITNRFQYLIGDIAGLKSTSGHLWNDVKVKNHQKHKLAFDEIKKLLNKIDEIAIGGPLDDVVSEMGEVESQIDWEESHSKKASISNLVSYLSKRLSDKI